MLLLEQRLCLLKVSHGLRERQQRNHTRNMAGADRGQETQPARKRAWRDQRTYLCARLSRQNILGHEAKVSCVCDCRPAQRREIRACESPCGEKGESPTAGGLHRTQRHAHLGFVRRCLRCRQSTTQRVVACWASAHMETHSLCFQTRRALWIQSTAGVQCCRCRLRDTLLVRIRTGTGYRYVKSLVTAAAEAVPSADVMAYVADTSVPCVFPVCGRCCP